MAIDELVLEAANSMPLSYASNSKHNVYFTAIDESCPMDDARRLIQQSSKRAIAYDLIPADSSIKIMYQWDIFINFIACVLNKKILYCSADPLDACEIAIFEPSNELGWHFDNSEFSITIMLQPAESGGEFQYVPNLRTSIDEGYGAVQNFLRNETDNIITPPQLPGTLSIFSGQYALHRVSKIGGKRPRINAVLSYGEDPNMRLSPLTQKLFYGRNV